MKKLISAISIFLVVVMLSSGAFAQNISDWAKDGFFAANSAGLLSYSLMARNLQGNITREEFSELVVNLYTNITQKNPSEPENMPFPDTQSVSVAKAHTLGIVSGDESGKFHPDREVTRQEMSKMLYNTLLTAGAQLPLTVADRKYIVDYEDKNQISSWALDSMVAMQKYELMNGVSQTRLAPLDNATREQSVILCERCYDRFSGRTMIKNTSSVTMPSNHAVVSGDLDIAWRGTLDAEVYHVIIKDEQSEPVFLWKTTDTSVTVPASTFVSGTSYTLLIGTQSNNGVETFSNPVTFSFAEKGKATPVPTASPTASPKPSVTPSPQPTATPAGVIASTGKDAATEKEIRVFPQGKFFASEEEAKAYMTEVTINVWNVADNGEKIASTRTLTVNVNLAEDVKAIFEEIFNSPEKFPIYSIGGYSWRKSSSGRLSQHSYGTCIDINPNENYQITSSGTVLSGSLWEPEQNQYSIAEDSNVVKIFAKYGWAWGGTAWSSSKDYMHFTYLGN